MKKLFTVLLLCLGLVSARKASAQAVQVSSQMRASSATTATGIAISTTYYHQISWTLIGPAPTACTITVDGSADNASFSTGSLIPAQTCTSSGTSPLVNGVAAYGRINLSTFTGSGTIFISYVGYSSGPAGVILSGTAVPTGTCILGALYTITSTGVLYSCNNGSWATVGGGSSGLSGMTGGQVAIAATATTVTSSKALSGSGAGITTGPASGVVSGDLASFTGTAGQIADSAIVAANVVTSASALSSGLLVAGVGGQGIAQQTWLGLQGTNELDIGGVGNGNAILGLLGTTSGTATWTAPAIAGTRTNPIVSSNTISGPAYATASNCIANGTAANPSVAACGSSAAGMFSCSTTASTGTCQVNTTAVTANSEIYITQNQADGGASQLNITCNTGLDLAAAAPVLKTKAAGSSFTINLGTVTANPACFEYMIIN